MGLDTDVANPNNGFRCKDWLWQSTDAGVVEGLSLGLRQGRLYALVSAQNLERNTETIWY